jgi:hypothetical protein
VKGLHEDKGNGKGSGSGGGGASVKDLVDRAKTVAAQICLLYHAQACGQSACAVTGCQPAKRAWAACNRNSSDPRQQEVRALTARVLFLRGLTLIGGFPFFAPLSP